jgi:hypothetical protein
MALRAIALHHTVAEKRLEQLFGSDWNQVFSGANATACGKCGTRFAFWFADRQDIDNPKYARSLEVKIAEDCQNAKHPLLEIQLNTIP